MNLSTLSTVLGAVSLILVLAGILVNNLRYQLIIPGVILALASVVLNRMAKR
jgi:hypothetical protein